MGNKREKIKTKKEDIINFWLGEVYEGDIGVDFSEAHERCWRCGYKAKLERCHIVPHSLGGEDKPSNYFLLCGICHSEGPNVSDPDIFIDCVKAHSIGYYDMYWTKRGVDEYKFIYKEDLGEELLKLGVVSEDITKLLEEEMEKCSWHFGQPRMNPATLAGLYRMIIKRLRSQKS